ncbi:MAG: YbaK/EbsC family protein [Candidatus Aenigmarchaeota archaeon]|nr:YbaK/EbsC family protein [Candidatus Aenigmarchaeota archaeon]MDI6721913.1 YbaK/EbsC family protein [Candidatus Aenigmarchaeota archaeon]
MEEQFGQIKKLLEKNGIEYMAREHAPVYTSEDAARIRGEELKTGVKALIFKSKNDFFLALVSGDKKIDTKKLRLMTGDDMHLANPQDVLECTGCEIGSVHPIGNLMKVKYVYADKRIFENEFVNFNAGLHTVSIRMRSKDLKKVVNPEIADYAK